MGLALLQIFSPLTSPGFLFFNAMPFVFFWGWKENPCFADFPTLSPLTSHIRGIGGKISSFPILHHFCLQYPFLYILIITKWMEYLQQPCNDYDYCVNWWSCSITIPNIFSSMKMVMMKNWRLLWMQMSASISAASLSPFLLFITDLIFKTLISHNMMMIAIRIGVLILLILIIICPTFSFVEHRSYIQNPH